MLGFEQSPFQISLEFKHDGMMNKQSQARAELGCDIACYVSQQPPPVTVHPRAAVHPASTSYCSTSLHEVLFIHPNRLGVWRPPRGPVHTVATAYCHGVMFIQWQPPTHGGGPVHPTPPGTVHPQPTNRLYSPHLDSFYASCMRQQQALFIQTQPNRLATSHMVVRSASVSSISDRPGSVSSEGVGQVQLATKGSIDQFQYVAVHSLGFSKRTPLAWV